MASSDNIIQLTTASHFPIKLTATNFPVWRKQVQSTLIGLALTDFIDSNATPPPQEIDDKGTRKPNPSYIIWYRQDQIIFGAILGSCSEAIQPIITSATTTKEAWKRLSTSYASQSRSRIISLKSKLSKNPKGNRPITEFLNEMRQIADELALVQNPIDEEDLLVHVLSQLGDEYGPIAAAIKVRENPMPFSELFDKLVDFERALKETETATAPLIVTANSSQRQPSRFNPRASSESQSRFNNPGRFNSGNQPRNNRQNNNTHYRNNNSSTYCQYCRIPGHETRDCRKLARLLRDNNITNMSNHPVANATSSSSTSNPVTTPWLFDTGASHHLTPDRSSLHTVSEYGGPDEIHLGDGYQNGGASHAGGEQK